MTYIKTDYKKVKDRRKARWEIELNPLVTFLVLLVIVGFLLVVVGIFEQRVNPDSGIISGHVSGALTGIKRWIDSVR